ncbi:TPA: MFS transporter [Pseudomonas aeruginosa]|nr:MFS transporter [Pseudomonas aeruginosa]
MAAIVLVGLNLRPSMAAVGPLLNAMRGEIALSFGDVSLLTALPMLTLGLGMFFGLGIARRVGEWRSVALALLLIGAASALRLGSRGLPDLLGSAMLAGLGIALIQALMPALIKARFGARTPLCMGLYVTAIMAGAALSASAAPTLAEHAGWRLGLGAWAALAALALLAWWLQPGTRLRLPDAQPGRSLLRYPRTWLLVLFFGLGTACYTCVLAWLAPYYLEQGWSAQESGLLLGFLTAMEVLSGLLAPALASRSRDRRPVLVGLTALMLAGFLGLAWAPASLPLLWALCLGLGIGGLFIATRGGMQPTHKSRAMLPHVEEMLARINACHAAQGSFDPRGEPRTFTLCAPEYVELLILPALLRRLAANGPRIGLDIRRLGPELPTEALLDGQVDLVFDFGPEYHRPAPELQALALFSDELLCVQDRAQPRHERLELDEFCRRRFVFPTPLDASNANLVDTWLRRQGRSREVAARANSYVAALQLLSGSDFVLMLPRRIHALLDDGRHHACLAPPGLPPFALHLSWSRAADQDPANLWLREQVLIVCAELGLL